MKQATALDILKSGKNVFLTGSAGAGKTYVLNQYIKYLRERKVPVAVTASTGIAATHMSGMTIHAWSGIGVKDSLSTADIRNLKTKKYLSKNMEKVKVLIIDEISMLHKNQLNMVNTVLKYFKEELQGFGGIQVVFSGDFFQLPPIGSQSESTRDKFAFMSAAWLEADLAICYLTEQHRQSENALTDILNEIRDGQVSQNSINLLKATTNNQLKDEEPPQLFTHNEDVDRINEQYLLKLNTTSKSYKAHTKGNLKLVETLKKSANAPEKLRLKVGAKVMFVKNNYEIGYVNGTVGEVMEFDEDTDAPIVKTTDGQIIEVEEQQWSIDNEKGSPLASYFQLPLRLAWAITVHKSQGMTLDTAEIDLSRTFERGQGYVALSRLKSIEGLRLKGFNVRAMEVDLLASKADKRFRELSLMAEQDIKTKPVDQLAKQFIIKCGGLADEEDIKKNKIKTAEKKRKKKESTYEITSGYIDQGLNLKEIAEKRGLSEGTVIGHLLKLRDENALDLTRFKPEDELLFTVGVAKRYLIANNPDAVKEDGSVSMKAIFEHLNGKVDYGNIKLALAFL